MMTGITPPTSYAEWVKILDLLKDRADDESVLAAMEQGTISWQSGIAERFSKKYIEVLNYRMNYATDRFQRELQRAAGQERVITQAIFTLRRELKFLVSTTKISIIPAKDQPQYEKLITAEANRIQSSLEASAKSDRTGKLASILRGNKVNVL